MKQQSGFLLVELSIALILAALSLALMVPLVTHIAITPKPSHTTLLKAHYDVAHILRMMTPLKSVEESAGKIIVRGACDEVVSISCAHEGCVVIRDGTTTPILPRSHTGTLKLTKKSSSVASLSITFANGESSLTLLHPLYII